MVGKKVAEASKPLQTRSGRCIKQNSDYIQKCAVKRERQNLIGQIKKALGKPESERSKDELDLLTNCKDLVQHVDVCQQHRATQAAHQEIVVDDEQLLEQKCGQLAKAISEAKSCIVYTGGRCWFAWWWWRWTAVLIVCFFSNNSWHQHGSLDTGLPRAQRRVDHAREGSADPAA